jgi:hypothetical protein
LFQQRRGVWLGFTGEFTVSDEHITFVVNVKNRASRDIYEIEVGPAGAGETLGQRGLARFDLRAGEEHKVEVSLPRPTIVDSPLGPGPVFKTMMVVLARYGDRRAWISQPAGPFRYGEGSRVRHGRASRGSRARAALRRVKASDE